MNFQNDKFSLYFATEEDNEEIKQIFEAGKFKGNLNIRYLKNPKPLTSFGNDGELAKIMVMRDNITGKLFAVGGVVIRKEYINGEIKNTGYLTGLKILPEYQKRIFFIPQAYQFLYENTKNLVDVYYTTILKENIHVQKMLEKGHKNMPTYKNLGEYITYCFKTGNKKCNQLLKGDIRGINHLIATHFSKYNFAPASRSLFGLSQEDFYTFRDDNGEILACCAVHNQQSYKQYQMCEYNRIFKVLSLLPTRLFGYPKFPKSNCFINYASLAFLYIKNNDLKLGERFLNAVANANGKYDVLLLGLFETNPLCKIFSHKKAIKYESKLYTVAWEKPDDLNGEIGVLVSLL